MNQINSHIQMPRFMLKRFENNNHYFYYYDVKQGFIGNRGTAKSINTELGYFSSDTEAFLSANVEEPFSELLRQIDTTDFGSPAFFTTSALGRIAKRFIYALMARNPQMIAEINMNSVFYRFLPMQIQHDSAVEIGIYLAEENDIFRDYFVTFAVNKSDENFVLPMRGFYGFKIKDVDIVFLPISPKLAIALVHRSGQKMFIHNGKISLCLIRDDAQVKWFNERAFAMQANAGYGYVVSLDKDSLERCCGAGETLA